MNPQKLLSPSALAIHLVLVAFFLIYARLFGPPEPEKINLPYEELKTTQEQSSEVAKSVEIDRSVLLTETRPGSMDHKSFYTRDGHLWGRLENSWIAQLTLDQRVQKASQYHFSKSKSAMGALALVEVSSGRVIGLSEFIDPSHPVTKQLRPAKDVHLGLQSIAPSSGGFRLITAAALLEAGVNPLQSFCYTKFKGAWIRPKHLSNRDPKDCNHLTEAISTTDNSYLALVSHTQLTADKLKKSALNLGFDRRYSYFGLPYELSVAHIPSDPIQRAKTAVGLIGSKMNVLHAAMFTAAIASDGTLKSPRLVEKIINEAGHEIEAPTFPAMANGVSPSTAARLRRMLKNAIHESPTGRVFQNWPDKLRRMRVAGQASVRTHRKPNFVRYTWFVGYVPAEAPQWAIAVMIVNNERWFVRALDIAHRVLKDVLSQLDE